MKTFAEAEQRLAQVLPGYESRPAQQRLAAAVEAVFANPDNFVLAHPEREITRRHLIGQAGCGTGKSLGYLIPAILSGRRVVVSVTTKALQDQLALKDLPFLAANLGQEFSWTVLKGRSNYFCSAKAADADEVDVPMLGQALKEAAVEGFSGERAAFSVEFTNAQWSMVNAEAEDCTANGCKERGDCFAELARSRAKACQIVVVNHALFFTDLIVKGLFEGSTGMLDEYDLVVFDEAHEAGDVAGDAIGGQFSEGTIRSLTGSIRTWATRYGAEGAEEALARPLTSLTTATAALFAALPSETQSKRLGPEQIEALADHLGGVYDGLREVASALRAAKISPNTDYAKAKARKDRLARQGNNTYARLIEIITADFAEIVRWVETERKQYRGRWEVRKVIKVAPVDVSAFLREHLFTQVPTVLVSATMAVKGSMNFIAGRLGIDNFDSMDVGTPFDFATQARLYVPISLPEPKGAQVQMWETMVVEEIVRLTKISNGRALILFTSNKQMQAAYNAASGRIGHPVKMQGQESVPELLSWFATETNGVLFGSKSFFTGVDIQGEALSLVVVVKMPFPVPTEPLTEARCEKIEAAGGNSFSDYTVPVMSLVLQQALGRLIRHTTDKGVAAILDPRMMTKGYGKTLIKDLPPMPVVTNLDQVEEFFVEVDAHYAAAPA